MNSRTSTWASILGILGSLLVIVVLVYAMYHYTHPAPPSENRVAERRKALSEIRQAEAKGMNEYGWVDQGKGIVSLPVSRAKELVLEEYKNPAVARSNMLARAEKANYVPPPPPAKPNQYE